MADRIEVELPSKFSDGDSSRWPTGAEYVWEPADRLYVEKLADFGRDLIQGFKDGQRYVFKDLPEGYRIYTKLRKDGKIKDRYVFGHPRGRFDSPNKFSVHFKWLMQGGTGSCTCVNCCPQAMRNSSLQAGAPTFLTSSRSIYDLSSQLKNYLSVFEENPKDVGEHVKAWKSAPQWASHEFLNGQSFEAIAAKYRALPSFIPRKGELVLFYLNERSDFRLEESTQHFKIFDKISGEFLGFPTWRAGVVAAEPNQRFGHDDLTTLASIYPELIDKCFRIELYPNPGSRNKSLSNQIYNIPLFRIRPLNMFHELLSGVIQVDWHESIHNTLKSVNTACIVDPIEFIGKWFSYSVRCRGVWLGPELYVKGDVVRLLPAEGTDDEIDQVMIINRIDHRFENNAVHDDRSSIIIAGPVITINKNRSSRGTPFTIIEKEKLQFPPSTNGYVWYPSDISTEGTFSDRDHESGSDSWQEVPLSFVVGRLYDSKAMKLLLNIDNFDVGGLGMKQARRWARRHRTDMKFDDHQEWILAMDRIEALDINVLDGRAVGKGAGSVNHGGNSHVYGNVEVSSDRKGKNGRYQGRKLFSQASHHSTGSGKSDDVYSRGRENRQAPEISDVDDIPPSDINGVSARSFESVVTGRRHSWFENKNEDENVIMEVIAGKGFPAEGEETDRDGAGEAQISENLKHHRPVKRSRI